MDVDPSPQHPTISSAPYLSQNNMYSPNSISIHSPAGGSLLLPYPPICTSTPPIPINPPSQHIPPPPTPSIASTDSLPSTHDTSRTCNSRNLDQIHLAIAMNNNIIGTYLHTPDLRIRSLPSNISAYISLPIFIEDSHPPPTNFRPLHIIHKIITTACRIPSPPPFIFDTSSEATAHNHRALQQYDFDIHQCIHEHLTSCTPRSEFRSVDLLHELFQHHTLWPTVRHMLSNGAYMHMTHEPEDTQRLLENEALLLLNNR